MSADPKADVGQSSHDECCLCSRPWTSGAGGWPLCDAPSCPNVCCARCAAAADLVVADLFYCPPCMGEGRTAAAAAGGAIAAAVAACAELDGLPASRGAVRRILGNLVSRPDEGRFRRLRLENPAVRKYVDLDPVRRILVSVGFVERDEVRGEGRGAGSAAPRVERVLLLEGEVDVDQIGGLIEVLDGLASTPEDVPKKKDDDEDDYLNGRGRSSSGQQQGEKRSSTNDTTKSDADVPDAKRQK